VKAIRSAVTPPTRGNRSPNETFKNLQLLSPTDKKLPTDFNFFIRQLNCLTKKFLSKIIAFIRWPFFIRWKNFF